MSRVPSFKEHESTHIIDARPDLDVLKSAAIYGTNAGGKSNFIRALVCMKKVITNSFSDSLKSLDEKSYYVEPFILDTKSEKENTVFEVSFIIKNTIYRYGFAINNFIIKKEWLYRKKEREVLLFNRENQAFSINGVALTNAENFSKTVNKNVLFLSHLAQNNNHIAKIVMEWFAGVYIISGLNDKSYKNATVYLLEKDPRFKAWATAVLKYLEISNIKAEENNGEIHTYHNKFDDNCIIVDSIGFTSSKESAGTNKLINLLGPIYITLKLGKILIVDEFDSKLHPNLSRKMVELFHEFNNNKSQIIFTANDAFLLNKELFRRDQIWFTSKDQYGASKLYSLSDFDSTVVRGTSAYYKKYLANEFGSANIFEIKEDILKLLYE